MRVSIFEEHSSVLPEWWCRKVRARTLICLDAHLDLQYVSPERLAYLEQCTSSEAVIRLEKPHHLLPDRHFSYSIKDFLFPAHRLGFIDRLVWVTPPHVETGYSQAAFDQLQQMDGVQFEELASFKRVTGGWIEGRLLGLDIAICNYLQLDKLPLPVDSLIDIDTDYFVTLPGDVAWVDPRKVFEFVNRLPLNPEWITLSRSVSSGFMPLRYRFFADYLAALWEHRHRDAAHYQRLFDLERQLQAKESDAVVTGCQRELECYPRCAASFYLLSLSERDPGRSGQYERQAGNLCSAYRPNLLRSACEFPSRELALQLSTVLDLEKQLIDIRDNPRDRALAHVAIGLIYCTFGHVDRAKTHYRQSEQHLGCHPELALEIGKLLLQSRPEQAVPFLEAAIHDDTTRAAAHVFLAHFYGKREAPSQALEHLETAHAITPAWGQLLPALAGIHKQLGNQKQYQTFLEEHQDRQLQTELLARQLSDHGNEET